MRKEIEYERQKESDNGEGKWEVALRCAFPATKA